MNPCSARRSQRKGIWADGSSSQRVAGANPVRMGREVWIGRGGSPPPLTTDVSLNHKGEASKQQEGLALYQGGPHPPLLSRRQSLETQYLTHRLQVQSTSTTSSPARGTEGAAVSRLVPLLARVFSEFSLLLRFVFIRKIKSIVLQIVTNCSLWRRDTCLTSSSESSRNVLLRFFVCAYSLLMMVFKCPSQQSGSLSPEVIWSRDHNHVWMQKRFLRASIRAINQFMRE